MKEDDKQLILIFSFLAVWTLSHNAQAINDLTLMIDDGGAGVCLAAENLTAPACTGETLTVDGTQDHLMYFLPEAAIPSNASIGQQFKYAVVTPGGMIVSLFFIILTCSMALGGVYLMVKMIRGVGGG